MEAAPHDKDIAEKLVPGLVKYAKDALPNLKIVICKVFKKVVTGISVSNNTTTLIKRLFNFFSI